VTDVASAVRADVDGERTDLSQFRRAFFSRIRALALRRTVLTVAVIAAVLRCGLALGSFLVNRTVLIPDEGQYLSIAQWMADGRTAESWQPGYGYSLFDNTRAFLWPLTGLLRVFGDVRLAGQLFAVVFGVVVAVLVTWMARRAVSPALALAAGLVMAVTPSQVLFSSVVLRESMVWASLALVGVGVVLGVDGSRRRLLLATVASAAGLLALGGLRDQTLVAAAWALPVAVFVAGGPRRAMRVVLACLVMLVVPIPCGAGVGGYELVKVAVPSLATTRAYNSLEAGSAFTPTTLVTTTTTRVLPINAPRGTTSGGRPTSTTSTTSTTVPPVRSEILGYDGERYAIDSSAGADLAALPRGLVATVLRPFPWEARPSISLLFARMENLLWYVLYGLAAVGVWAWRRNRATIAFPVVVTIAVVTSAAVSQGNLGTAFRHRGQILWAVVLLAVVGAQHLLELRVVHRARALMV
jgi:hypothetical protein